MILTIESSSKYRLIPYYTTSYGDDTKLNNV